MVARKTAAIVLPATISRGVNGDTTSCSYEPSSRSLAIEVADEIIPTVVIIRHTNPGINETLAARFGLNHLRTIIPDDLLRKEDSFRITI